jgi:ribosome-associated heat shock protein Hsp15
MTEKGLQKSDMRADKWLWAVRLFKTRSLSAEACRKGRVMIGDIIVKPSRVLRAGDIISLRRPPSVYTYKVLSLTDSRLPAKLVGEYVEDLTPEEEKEKSLHKNLLVFAKRDRGTGRPTKRERRNIDRLNESDS